MSSNHSGRTTPHSDVNHPHRITYSPFNEEEDPQPVPMLPPRPPTPGPIALVNKKTQTSPRPCPVHQQQVAIITTHIPLFARQIQSTPTLQEALKAKGTTSRPEPPDPHHHPLRTPQLDVHSTSSIQKPHHRRKPTPQRKTKKNIGSKYHRGSPPNRRPTLLKRP